MLLHGFPQTHLMWRDVAAELATDHTVICPDLRGYGASDKPAERLRQAHDGGRHRRARPALGHERFALAGHDRGALVAFRAGLDHPDAITRLACLDVLPTLDMWDVLHGTTAAVGFHLYLMAQPPGLPERMIAASADAFFGHFLDAWGNAPFPPEVRAAYLKASREAVPSIVADYRASAGIDVAHDQADRDAGHRLAMPVTVLQQDWGAALGYDARALWQRLGHRPRPPHRAAGATSWPRRRPPRSRDPAATVRPVRRPARGAGRPRGTGGPPRSRARRSARAVRRSK